MYGVRAMPLPASMICLTASGASSGGRATPLPSAIALSTALLPPDAGLSPRTAAEAALVGLASLPVSPASEAASVEAGGEDATAPPATGATVLAREDCGTGGSSTVSSVSTGATSGVEVALAAAVTGWSASEPDAPSAR